MNERRIKPRSRHTWHGIKCVHCGMTRHKAPARSRRGCFGWHEFERTVYRRPNGSQAGGISQPNRVPPCEPPCSGCGERRYHAPDCPAITDPK